MSLCLWSAWREGVLRFHPVCFLTQCFHPSCRERSLTTSARPLEHGDLHLHLLFAYSASLSSAHPHGALLPASSLQSFATGFFHVGGPAGYVPRPLPFYAPFIQVSVLGSSPSTVRCSESCSLGLRQEGMTPHDLGTDGQSVLLLRMFPFSYLSSLLGAMFVLSRLTVQWQMTALQVLAGSMPEPTGRSWPSWLLNSAGE